MKKLLSLIIMASCGPVVAQMPQHYFNPKEPNKLYLVREACPDECFEVVKDGKLIGDLDVLEIKEVSEEICEDDLSKPLWSKKSQEQKCDGEEECQKILSELKCEVGQSFIDEDFKEVYCSQRMGFEKTCHEEKSKRAFVNDEKKASKDKEKVALEEAKAAKEQAKVERLQKIKDFDLNSANSIAKLKDLLKEIQDDYKDR